MRVQFEPGTRDQGSETHPQNSRVRHPVLTLVNA